jgi:hypothetical protein
MKNNLGKISNIATKFNKITDLAIFFSEITDFSHLQPYFIYNHELLRKHKVNFNFSFSQQPKPVIENMINEIIPSY